MTCQRIEGSESSSQSMMTDFFGFRTCPLDLSVGNCRLLGSTAAQTTAPKYLDTHHVF